MPKCSSHTPHIIVSGLSARGYRSFPCCQRSSVIWWRKQVTPLVALIPGGAAGYEACSHAWLQKFLLLQLQNILPLKNIHKASISHSKESPTCHRKSSKRSALFDSSATCRKLRPGQQKHGSCGTEKHSATYSPAELSSSLLTNDTPLNNKKTKFVLFRLINKRLDRELNLKFQFVSIKHVTHHKV